MSQFDEYECNDSPLTDLRSKMAAAGYRVLDWSDGVIVGVPPRRAKNLRDPDKRRARNKQRRERR